MQDKSIQLEKQKIIFEDLGTIRYKTAWEYQEQKVTENLQIKAALRNAEKESDKYINNGALSTNHYVLFCEHPPVYTLGKSGHAENVLLSLAELEKRNIEFFQTNRGGDITFHGLDQVVGYPILDLEKFSTDLGKYLRNLEEVIIRTIAEYGIIGGRSKGQTGVWIDNDIPGKERKICALGIRCSRWVTMHGFALNVNTDLSYFKHIIPCGIANKQVTSLENELGYKVDISELKEKLVHHFCRVFDVDLVRNKEAALQKSY